MHSSGISNREVVVIGAGIIGAATALVLQRQGFSVTLVDKGPPGMECSYGNGGAISPDFCVPASLPGMLKRVPRWLADPSGPLVIRWGRLPVVLPWMVRWIRAGSIDRVEAAATALRALHAPSLTAYARLLGPEAAGLIETTGQIYVWKSERAGPTETLARALREKHGVQTQALDAAQIRQLDPQLAPGFTKGLFFSDNGHTVNPLRLVQTLVDLFQQIGGRLRRAEVLGLERQAKAVKFVCCDDGVKLAADAVVIAAGMRSRELAALLGDSIPLEAERGYHVMLPDPHVRPAIKISNRDLMFGLTPMEHGVRIAGTVEFAKPNAPMDEQRARALLANAKRMYPGLNTDGATFWMGSRPSTPDSLPVIDRASTAPNVIYAFGHGHTGLTGAPMTAELTCQLLSGARSAIDISPYRLSRF
ncbi:FAD-binding oxidoreductase [Paralcaligenes sp. KSB-10]|jgi:D-amino-acid dehydrogenase|uniref:NAD(P)/FAD-dependent oxidoreductase n=1 Tax=Paralcaligenes sp. KSB-10 TaxID=2901142 RepID=UPI001E2EEAB3|nr:FAD-dependent oxidoreductase [Paralcaligenes sp. KSB-10]UHL65406.1 FAD-binding oxidoreductase [Paralcaligenes sp. KSB-10]